MNEYRNLEDVFKLYEKHGSKGYIGEPISQYEHAMQAALLAEDFFKCAASNVNSEVILGAFLHDIGHLLRYESWFNGELMGDLGVMDHEKVGAIFLSRLGFPDKVCKLVAAHIVTKRYLITKNPDYFENLSFASKQTFEYQGGKLDYVQKKAFENDDLFNFHLRIREWDDKAKETDKELLHKISEINPREYFQKYLDHIRNK
jgi:2-amino-1-hydroxyethylphosphonate dioxygenase (glycine-forming)